ncbi:hypothetical protein CDIK_2235 [Cucumispora dikerogammari]|nr:hypothetical protein CDIK_2235 [Cucumispora dikerogammari]
MLSKILHLLPTTLTYNSHVVSDAKRNYIWEQIIDYKDKIENVFSFAEGLEKEFNEKLKEIVEEKFPSPTAGPWLLSEEKQNSENEPLSPKFLDLKEQYRRLFFIDFLSLCKEFFFKILSMYEKLRPGFYLEDEKLVYDIVKQKRSKDVLAQKHDGNFSLKTFMKNKGFIFKNFFNRFEQLVISQTGNSKEILRHCLYSNPEYSFDVMKNKNIMNFYTAVDYFYWHIDYINFKQNEPIPIINIRDTKTLHFNKAIQNSLFLIINKHYKKYLKIDIVAEHKRGLKYINNYRFDSFIQHKELFIQCCYKTNDNLLTLNCGEHRDIIDKIKVEYFRTYYFNYCYVEDFKTVLISYTDYQVYRRIFCQ